MQPLIGTPGRNWTYPSSASKA